MVPDVNVGLVVLNFNINIFRPTFGSNGIRKFL